MKPFSKGGSWGEGISQRNKERTNLRVPIPRIESTSGWSGCEAVEQRMVGVFDFVTSVQGERPFLIFLQVVSFTCNFF